MPCTSSPQSESSPLRTSFFPTVGMPTSRLLTADQERELAAAVARGDADARDRLVESNLRLVFTVARSYLGHGLEMDDLVGEGNLGLIRAAQDFRGEFGTRFSTYAGHWIKEAIRNALTNRAATIRLPAHMVKLLTNWSRAERTLGRELGREPTADEVAVTLGLTDSQRGHVEHALRARRMHQERPEGDGLGEYAGATMDRPGAEIERAESVRGLRARMEERLDDRERELVALRFGLGGGDPLTLKEAGERLGVTREWARKLEIRAIAKLRDAEHE